MTTSILRSLVYPLPSTTFSKQECIKILRPVLLNGLPASGIARTFPRALVHAPLKYQGLSLPNLWIEQGVAHLHSVITHSHLSSITGQLIRASLEAYILDLGLPGTPLFHGSTPFESNTTSNTQQLLSCSSAYVTPCWWSHLSQFLLEYDISLRISDTLQIPCLRLNDSFLMDHFIQSG